MITRSLVRNGLLLAAAFAVAPARGDVASAARQPLRQIIAIECKGGHSMPMWGADAVCGVDAETGSLIWRKGFFKDEVNFVEDVDGGFLIGLDEGALILLSKQGEEIWKAEVPDKKPVNTFRGARE